MVGGSEVFIYRELRADSVGGEVVDRGEGGSLEFEDEAADSFGVKFDNNGGGGGVLLGGNGEGIGEDKVTGRDRVRGYVASLLRSDEDGADDLLVDDVGDLRGWSGGRNRESVDAEGI